MITLGLLLATASGEMVLNCRSDRANPADSSATEPFTLIESDRKVRYFVPNGVREVAADFTGDEVSFPDNWPPSFQGGYVINRRLLTYQRLVTFNEKVIVDERGSCRIFVPPPEIPNWMLGAKPPPD